MCCGRTGWTGWDAMDGRPWPSRTRRDSMEGVIRGSIHLITQMSTEVSKQQQIDTRDETLTALPWATTDLAC
jgi:hypothetical protein